MHFAWNHLNKEDIKLLTIICWHIWYERNQWLHGSPPTPCLILLQRAWLYWESIQAVNNEYTPQSLQLHHQVHWVPPAGEFYKLNVDGATANIHGRATRGVGGIVRNHEGLLMGAFAKHENCDISVLATELLAMKIGLEFALEYFLSPLIVESDCLEAVKLVNSNGASFADVGILVSEI